MAIVLHSVGVNFLTQNSLCFLLEQPYSNFVNMIDRSSKQGSYFVPPAATFSITVNSFGVA